MADNSRIEWTEATWNPVTGCSKVSQGCKNCYALRDWPRLAAPRPKPNIYTGRAFTDVRCHSERLDQPLRWTKPRRIFVNSMSDLFHESAPFEFIADVFAVMACTTRHTYQVLTKRPARMIEFFQWLRDEYDPDISAWGVQMHGYKPSHFWPHQVQPTKVWPNWQPWREGKQGGYDNCGPAWPLENVWLGVSVEDQDTANERIPLLLQTPAAVRWISAEPLLGPISMRTAWMYSLAHEGIGFAFNETLDWVVVGGESGPNARPMHPDWARSLRDQCHVAGVPFFFKQWGEWQYGSDYSDKDRIVLIDGTTVRDASECTAEQRNNWTSLDPTMMSRVGKKTAGRELDGSTWEEYPTCPA